MDISPSGAGWKSYKYDALSNFLYQTWFLSHILFFELCFSLCLSIWQTQNVSESPRRRIGATQPELDQSQSVRIGDRDVSLRRLKVL
nr:hypothetical protein CFP56_53917 [Quercus suber]